MQNNQCPRISGRVVTSSTRRRLEGVTVAAYRGEEQVGFNYTDSQGIFNIPVSVDFEPTVRGETLTFLVSTAHTQIALDAGPARWTTLAPDSLVTIELDDSVEGLGPPPSWVRVDSMDSLNQHQAAILERINEIPSGGLLFTVHPFLLLEDIGVELTDTVRAEIVRHLPHLTTVSATAYQAIKANPESARVTVRLRGLFNKRETE